MDSELILYCYDGFNDDGNPLTERTEMFISKGVISNGKYTKMICVDNKNMFKELDLSKCKLISDNYKKGV